MLILDEFDPDKKKVKVDGVKRIKVIKRRNYRGNELTDVVFLVNST